MGSVISGTPIATSADTKQYKLFVQAAPNVLTVTIKDMA